MEYFPANFIFIKKKLSEFFNYSKISRILFLSTFHLSKMHLYYEGNGIFSLTAKGFS